MSPNETASFQQFIVALIICVIAMVIYFLPTIIAFERKHASRLAILAVNWLLGWTGLFWFITLFWALGNPMKNQQQQQQQQIIIIRDREKSDEMINPEKHGR